MRDIATLTSESVPGETLAECTRRFQLAVLNLFSQFVLVTHIVVEKSVAVNDVRLELQGIVVAQVDG
jgi:hypothetical protein